MKLGSGTLAAVTSLLLSCLPTAHGAGVTFITHGLNGNADGWVTGLASQIPNRPNFPGTSYTLYKIYFYYSAGYYYLTSSRIGGSQPSSTESGEIVVVFDWSELANGDSYNTYQIASAVAPALLSTTFIAELNGHALAELPLHFIGHSRGGSLVCELSRQLGTNGVWADHITTLDPHPLNDAAFPLDSLLYSAIDAPAETYENVLYHDNYWQNLDLFVYGKSVAGAYVRELYNLTGGYSSSHSDVHLWYHGTVDVRVPASDTEAQITVTEFNNWYVAYENYSYKAGFIWSLIGRGDRTSTDRPVGPGYPAIRDGYNQTWDLGAGQTGNRNSLPSNNGNWPNVMKLNVVSTDTAPQGSNIFVKYFYQWAQPSTSMASLSFYLDDDFNPYNTNSRLLQQIAVPGNGASYVSSQTLNFALNSTNAPVGHHVLYARIAGGGRTRYLYAPEILTALPPPDTTRPSVSITNPPGTKTYTNAQIVTISATATDNVAVASVEFYDGATLKGSDTSAAYTCDWSFTAADNGTHVWTARAYDGAGNVSTSSPVTLTVSIDATPPTVAITSPANGANLTTSTTPVSGTASDPGSPSSGLSLVEVRHNGGSWQTVSGTASWNKTVNLVLGGNSIEARSRDKAGNYSLVSSNFVRYVDSVLPTVAITSPVTGQRWSNALFSVTGTASDNLQLGGVWYQLNGAPWALAQSANGWTNWSANVMPLPGTNSIAAYAADTSGNKSATNRVALVYVVTNQLVIRATGQGTLSPNYSNAWLEIGRRYTNTATGANGHVFTNWVISTNWVGGVTNTNAALSFVMQSNLTFRVGFVDVTKPAVSLTNAVKTYTNSQTVTVSATASDNVGVTNVAFYDGPILKGGDVTPAYTYGWSFTAADNGPHVWTARAYDAAGNVSTSSVVTLTVSIDNTPPTVGISSPTNGQVLTNSPLSIRGTATDPGLPTSGVSVVQVRLNGGSWSNATGTTTWTNTMTLSLCANTLEARSLDKAGNYSAIASNSFTYTPPNTVPVTPSNVSPHSGAKDVPIMPTLQASAFSDADCVGDTHAASQWQVLNSPGTVTVADSGTDTVNRASWLVPTNKLHYGSNYQWRVRYRDSRNGWSSYSAQTRFTNSGPRLSGLKQGTNVVFKWPTNSVALDLQWSTNLGTAYWSNATPGPVVVGGQYTVTNNMTNKFRFYRLKK